MPLPTEKSPAQPRMGKVLIFGEPKVAGKSTLAMTLDPDHTIALDTEDGLGAIEGYKHRVTSWGRTVGVEGEGRNARPILDEHSFRGTIQMLATQEHPFKIGVVDTADALSFMCSEYVLAALGGDAARAGQFVHASDFEYGKGWEAVRSEWQLRLGALFRVLESVVLISHADRRVETDRIGAEYPIYTAALAPKGIRNWTLGAVDHILFARVEANEDGEPTHCVRTQPSRSWEAGGRTVAGGPKLPDPIWLPNAATAGVELRKALEAVSAPPVPPKGTGEAAAAVDAGAKPKPKPKPKSKAAAKSAAQEQLAA